MKTKLKTKLLRILRKKTWDKYEIRNWSSISGCREKPWRICTGPNSSLAYHEYKTKEEAVNAVKLLWHEEAEKYLWEHRTERKRNKYPW